MTTFSTCCSSGLACTCVMNSLKATGACFSLPDCKNCQMARNIKMRRTHSSKVLCDCFTATSGQPDETASRTPQHISSAQKNHERQHATLHQRRRLFGTTAERKLDRTPSSSFCRTR